MVAQGDPEAEAELAALPHLPDLGAHLWLWWRDLHSTRQSNGMGPVPLTRQEIRLWEADEGRMLSMWERRALLDIDATWRRIATEQMSKRNEGAAKP